MAEIKQFIKSKTDKTKIYPRTLAKAVYMGDGKTTVEESLEHITQQKADDSKVNNIQGQINNLVLGAVGDGNNAEVVQARGEFEVLNDRLLEIENTALQNDYIPIAGVFSEFNRPSNNYFEIISFDITDNYTRTIINTITSNSDTTTNFQIRYRCFNNDGTTIAWINSDIFHLNKKESKVIKKDIVFNPSTTLVKVYVYTDEGLSLGNGSIKTSVFNKHISDDIYNYVGEQWIYNPNKIIKSFISEKSLDTPKKLSDLEKDIDLSSQWSGKKWLTYGDSITAIGNINGLDSWQDYVTRELGFSTHYGRGIGGQMFKYNTEKFVANSDGSFNSKNVTTIPDGCTEHVGAFCSWDRITAMIPENLRNDLDLVFIMGGTNDFGNNVPLGDIKFYNGSQLDEKFYNSDYYIGGEFDALTFKSAIASTIVKFQIWCPNAVICLGTPLSGRGNIAGENMTSQVKNSLELTTLDYAKALKEVAEEFSIPVIDVFSKTGINQFNRNQYIKDTVHPYPINCKNEGNKAIARAIIGELKNIYNKI